MDKVCLGVPDSRCNYLATCGEICNKCGQFHNPAGPLIDRLKEAETNYDRGFHAGQRWQRDDGWLPIESAPKDGTEILVLIDIASVWVAHIAWWRSAEDVENMSDGTEDDIGWWSYVTNSVSQEKLDDWRTPQFWMPFEAPK